jgi:hypothetical protein
VTRSAHGVPRSAAPGPLRASVTVGVRRPLVLGRGAVHVFGSQESYEFVVDVVSCLWLTVGMATHTTTATRSEIIEALERVFDANKHNTTGIHAFSVDAAADAILAGQVTPDDNYGRITDPTVALAFGALMSDGPWWQAATWTEELVDGEWVQFGDYDSAPIPADDAAAAAVARSTWETCIGPDWHIDGEAATYRVVWETIDGKHKCAAQIDVYADGHIEITGVGVA